jgi:hypothetical protein
MDRLVSGAWLEKELGAPDLRLLDCTVASEVLPQGGVNYRSGRPVWERRHIPGWRPTPRFPSSAENRTRRPGVTLSRGRRRSMDRDGQRQVGSPRQSV